jgi:hypothetical protein
LLTGYSRTEFSFVSMKIFLKIAKLLAILILTVSIILIAASFLLRDKVGFLILKSINKDISTKLEVGSYKLSFLKKFPNASLELKNVLVHSSPDFNSSSFGEISTDTLLSARLVSLEFKLTDILKGDYTIESISAKTGKVNFFTDTAGHINYNISVKSTGSGDKLTVIDLKKISVSDIKAYYNNLGAHLIIAGPIKAGKLKSKISGSTIDFTAGTEIKINRFDLYNFKLGKSIPAKLDVNLQSTRIGISFKKSVMHIDNYDIGLEGTVNSGDILDLTLSGHNLDIARMRNYLPEKILRSISDYDLGGTVNATSKIKGELSHKMNPHVEIDYQLKNGRIVYKKSNLAIKDLTFSGHLSNGSGNQFETSSVSIKDFKSKLGSSEYTGSANLKNFNNAFLDLELKGRVIPKELKEFFSLQNLSAADGSVDMELKINNAKWAERSFSADGIIDLKPEANLTFNSLTIGFNNDKVLFSNINGKLAILNSIRADNFKFKYKEQNFNTTGDFYNLPEWLMGRKVTMTAKAVVSCDKLMPEKFFSFPAPSKKNIPGKKVVSLPGDMKFDITFRLDSISYKIFSASEVEGNLIYQPRYLTFKSLNMKSLDGIISGNGFIVQNKDRGLITKGNFIVKDIDVNKAFTTFHNFGQSFLKAENIKGSLSGSLALLFPVDSLLNFHIKTLTAEGKYRLMNGALINFDPVKQLSSFIELSELKNITFEELENDFSIRNNLLYIPQMEVKSSAADLSVNGKHSFDNNYEYHVRILLSEILSRKRIKNRHNESEFGVVEDDGLGRTSLLLKIIGKGEEAKVGYDVKAAGTLVKDNFKKEKQSIKTILNEEYGLYKKDTTLKPKTEEKKSRFKIKWDDGEAEKPAQEVSTGKSLPIKK